MDAKTQYSRWKTSNDKLKPHNYNHTVLILYIPVVGIISHIREITNVTTKVDAFHPKQRLVTPLDANIHLKGKCFGTNTSGHPQRRLSLGPNFSALLQFDNFLAVHRVQSCRLIGTILFKGFVDHHVLVVFWGHGKVQIQNDIHPTSIRQRIATIIHIEKLGRQGILLCQFLFPEFVAFFQGQDLRDDIGGTRRGSPRVLIQVLGLVHERVGHIIVIVRVGQGHFGNDFVHFSIAGVLDLEIGATATTSIGTTTTTSSSSLTNARQGDHIFSANSKLRRHGIVLLWHCGIIRSIGWRQLLFHTQQQVTLGFDFGAARKGKAFVAIDALVVVQDVAFGAQIDRRRSRIVQFHPIFPIANLGGTLVGNFINVDRRGRSGSRNTGGSVVLCLHRRSSGKEEETQIAKHHCVVVLVCDYGIIQSIDWLSCVGALMLLFLVGTVQSINQTCMFDSVPCSLTGLLISKYSTEANLTTS